MDPRVEPQAQQFTGGAFECRVRGIGVGPLDQDAFALNVTRGGDGCRGVVAADVEGGTVRVVGSGGPFDRRVLDMDGVEPAVAPVVGIELQADETVALANRVGEPVEESGVTRASVEVEVGRERLRLLVEDVQRPVQIVHEEAVRAARFFAQRIDARQHPVGLPLAIDVAGDGSVA